MCWFGVGFLPHNAPWTGRISANWSSPPSLSCSRHRGWAYGMEWSPAGREGEGCEHRRVSETDTVAPEREREKGGVFSVLWSSACGATERTDSVCLCLKGRVKPLSLQPSLSLSPARSSFPSFSLKPVFLLLLALHVALRQICADRRRASVKAKSFSPPRPPPLCVWVDVCVFKG